VEADSAVRQAKLTVETTVETTVVLFFPPDKKRLRRRVARSCGQVTG
jgi:hypothetical protein